MISRLLLGLAILAISFSPTIAQTAIEEVPLDANRQSVASQWVSEALLAVSDPAGGSVGPTGASRAYGMLGTAMYDAWSAYEALPTSTVLGDSLQQSAAKNTTANKSEAISHAAYTVLADLFPDAGLQQKFRTRMTSLGYDPDNASSQAATIGVTMANELLGIRHNDGSNQLNGYADTTGYAPVNSVTNMLDLDAWTPENVPIGDTSGPTQTALHPHWGSVTPFALNSGSEFRPPAPQSFLIDPAASVDLSAKTLTRSNGTTVSISRDLIGIDINPEFINQAIDVVTHSVNLGSAGGDRRKLIAEFWEDPTGTPYPPGTWMFFAQKVGESISPDLDSDVPMFFGVGNAVMDAGIATWEAKYEYD